MNADQKKGLRSAVKLIEDAGLKVGQVEREERDKFDALEDWEQDKAKNIKHDDNAYVLEDFGFRIGELASELEDFIKSK